MLAAQPVHMAGGTVASLGPTYPTAWMMCKVLVCPKLGVRFAWPVAHPPSAFLASLSACPPERLNISSIPNPPVHPCAVERVAQGT